MNIIAMLVAYFMSLLLFTVGCFGHDTHAITVAIYLIILAIFQLQCHNTIKE